MFGTLRRVASSARWRGWIQGAPPLEGEIAVGKVELGDLGRVTPFNEHSGLERDPKWVIDRYYIWRFLEGNRYDVRGAVLEVDSEMYTRLLAGDRVQRVDVLSPLPGHPTATVTADLSSADGIPADSYDCFICTQTLPYIWDLDAAVRHIHRVLKPGGVLLLTVPGISRTDAEADGETFREYWRFTTHSVRRLLEPVFGAERLSVECRGNVLTATAMLFGLSGRDLTRGQLEFRDPAYQVTITARAVKAA